MQSCLISAIRASHVFAAGPPGVAAGRAYFVTTSGATAWTKGATEPGFSAAIRPPRGGAPIGTTSSIPEAYSEVGFEGVE